MHKRQIKKLPKQAVVNHAFVDGIGELLDRDSRSECRNPYTSMCGSDDREENTEG